MIIQPPQQRSYLLRLWQTSNRNSLKASLIDVHDASHKLHFATLEDLYTYLKETAASTLCKETAESHDKNSESSES